MIALDTDDVAILGHGPIRSEHAFLRVLDRICLAQPLEIGPMGIGAEQLGMTAIEMP